MLHIIMQNYIGKQISYIYIYIWRNSKMCQYIMDGNINMDFCILIYCDLQLLTWKQNIFTLNYYIIVEELQGWKYQYGFLHVNLPWFKIIDLKTKYIYMHIIYIEHYIIVERTSKMCKYIMVY